MFIYQSSSKNCGGMPLQNPKLCSPPTRSILSEERNRRERPINCYAISSASVYLICDEPNDDEIVTPDAKKGSGTNAFVEEDI